VLLLGLTVGIENDPLLLKDIPVELFELEYTLSSGYPLGTEVFDVEVSDSPGIRKNRD
jgi:hypothetical protein